LQVWLVANKSLSDQCLWPWEADLAPDLKPLCNVTVR
jgi:hypothetical protein